MKPNQIKHIYWFAYFNPRLPGVRYRGLYPLDRLKKTREISSDIVYPGYSPFKLYTFFRVYFKVLFAPKANSVIVIQKVYTRKMYANLLKLLVRYRKNTIYDIDDAEYLERSDKTIHYFMQQCNFCMVGSEAIRKHTSLFNANVFVNTSPVIEHKSRKKFKNTIPVFGWIGCYGGGHKQCLLENVIPALLASKHTIKFILLGVTRKKDMLHLQQLFASHKNITLEIPMRINWYDEEGIYNRIAEMDFGLAPLQNTEMHLSKSAFKLKQYFSCGVPVIGSNLGENGKFLLDSINGFVAHTQSDYATAFDKVLQLDMTEYSALSERARNAHAYFSLDQYNQTFLTEAEKLI